MTDSSRPHNEPGWWQGSVLGEDRRWKVGELLGVSANGETYVARDLLARRRVVLKILSWELARDAGVRERLPLLVSRLGAMGHRNVARVHHYPMALLDEPADARETYFVVSEFLEGRTLDRRVAREGPLEVEEAVFVTVQVLDVLASAHQRELAHQNIKPRNLFLQRGRGQKQDYVKLLDFALIADGGSSSLETSSTGQDLAPAYACPDQVRGPRFDASVDLYSLGATLYFALSGQAPFEPADSLGRVDRDQIIFENPPLLHTLRPDLPPGLVQVVVKAMHKFSSGRYREAEEMREALAPWYADPREEVLCDCATNELPAPEVLRAVAAAPPAPRARTPPADEPPELSMGDGGWKEERRTAVLPPEEERALLEAELDDLPTALAPHDTAPGMSELEVPDTDPLAGAPRPDTAADGTLALAVDDTAQWDDMAPTTMRKAPDGIQSDPAAAQQEGGDDDDDDASPTRIVKRDDAAQDDPLDVPPSTMIAPISSDTISDWVGDKTPRD